MEERRSLTLPRENEEKLGATTTATALTTSKKKRKHSSMSTESLMRETFPLKLFQLLSEQGQGDIIKWLGNGEFFKIFDKKRFLCEIVPKYFNRKLCT